MRPVVPTALSALALALTLAVPASAQITVEAHAGVGYTVVDLERWAGGPVNDWDQFSSGGYVQAFFLERSNVRVGAEVGYAYFFWYQVPFGTTSVAYDIDAYHFLMVARREISSHLFAEVGAGFFNFIYGGFHDPGASAALGGRIPVTDALSIPVKLRANFIMDVSAIVMPFGLSVGLSYRLGGD